MTLIDSLVMTLNLDASKFKAGQVQANAGLKAMGEGATKTGADVQRVAQGMAQGFSRVRTELLGLLGLFVAGRTFKSLTSEITTQDAALGRLSGRLGVSTQDLSAWDRAAQSAGANAGEATGSFATMSAALERFKLTGEGGPTFIPWLSRLGAHLRNANGEMKNATEQQLELARVFQEQDRKDSKATDFYASQLPGMTQGMTDFLRRGPEFVQSRLDKQRAIGLPTRQDTLNAQNILEQLGYIDNRAQTFGRHLLNDVSPGITRLLTRLGDWLDQRLPGWYAKIDPIIQRFMGALDRLDFDQVGREIVDFGHSVHDTFETITKWRPPAWIARLFGIEAGADTPAGQGATPGDAGSTSGADHPIRRWLEEHIGLGQNVLQPIGTKADDTEMAAADRNGVPRDFARKLFTIEHGVDVDGKALTSPAGAIGAGQLMPATAKELGVDPYNLEQNADGSTRYMKKLLEQFHGNQEAAAAAYNAGPNHPGVLKFAATGDTSGLPEETRKYVERFSRHWSEADTSGRNGGLHKLDDDGSFLYRLRHPPPELSAPLAPWVRPPMPEWRPVEPIRKLPEDGKNYPGDDSAEKPDLDGLKRFLGGQGAQPVPAAPRPAEPPLNAGQFLVTNAQRRWGQAPPAVTQHDNSSTTTINGPIHVHTQAKDAHGIARDLKGELRSRTRAAQANRGLT